MKFSWKALSLAPLLMPFLYSMALVIILLPSGSPLLFFLIMFGLGSLFSYAVTIFLFLPGLFLISRFTPLTTRWVAILGTVLGSVAYLPVVWQTFLASGDNSGPPSGSFADHLWTSLFEPITWAFPVAGLVTALVYWFFVNQPPRNRHTPNPPRTVTRIE